MVFGGLRDLWLGENGEVRARPHVAPAAAVQVHVSGLSLFVYAASLQESLCCRRPQPRGQDAEDVELLAELDAVFDETKIFEETDVARFKHGGLHGAALLEKYLFSPVINIDGLNAGHTGSGVKTVIGHEARASSTYVWSRT